MLVKPKKYPAKAHSTTYLSKKYWMKTYLKKTDFVILSAQSWQQVERFV